MNKTALIFAIGAFASLVVTTVRAHAEADLILEPERIECSIFSNPGYWACHVKYDGLQVVEGRAAAPAKAQADCVVCRNFVAAAKKKGMKVGIRRYLNWNSPDLMYLTPDDVPDGASCEPPPPVGRRPTWPR